MYNNELYNYIYKADIQNSIYLVTKLILEDNYKNIEIIEQTFIAICSYIGTFISLYDIKLWIDIIEETNEFLKQENIVIKNIYLLITKLCIVCDIYIKNPVSKSGILPVVKLREKIKDYFNFTNPSLNYLLKTEFDSVLPPNDSDAYNLSEIIILGITNLLKNLENLDINKNSDLLFNLANELKNIFDYLSRKNYKFENKYENTDNDSIWFLWGILKVLYNEDFVNICYNLFNYNYTKKAKTERIGLLYGMAVCLVYIEKKNIGRVWNNNEIMIIKKINEIGMKLYKEIKTDLKRNNVVTKEKEDCNNMDGIDGLDILDNYVPLINTNISGVIEYNNSDEGLSEIKKILYDKK